MGIFKASANACQCLAAGVVLCTKKKKKKRSLPGNQKRPRRSVRLGAEFMENTVEREALPRSLDRTLLAGRVSVLFKK